MAESLLITEHRYIAQYPIDRSAKKLILGTIHPHFVDQFEMDFFYGNELSIWKILNKAFPHELSSPRDIRDVKHFLATRQIAISDTILTCERLNPTALDEDLRVLHYHDEALLSAIKESAIAEILCTSGFDANNAFRIFYTKILKLRLTNTIKRDKYADLPVSIFGRNVSIRAVYSPSSSANRGIGKSKGYKAVKHLMSTDAYRIELYKEYFKP